MRTICRLVLVGGILAANAYSASVLFQVSDEGVTGSGDPVFRYTYTLSGLAFERNMELDLRFDPALYGVLSNPVAPSGFDVLILQPNNPPGAFGDYSILALVDNPSVAGPFSVDFTFLGQGTPGPQPFFLNQYDDNLNLLGTTGQGRTEPVGGSAIPEPASVVLTGSVLLIAGLALSSRRLRAVCDRKPAVCDRAY